MPTVTAPITAQGTILGTFQYMAPEQIEGGEADARTDIFAFGVLLYEMVAGRPAFQGKSQASLIGAILKDTPPPLTAVQPDAPPPLDYLDRDLHREGPRRARSKRSRPAAATARDRPGAGCRGFARFAGAFFRTWTADRVAGRRAGARARFGRNPVAPPAPARRRSCRRARPLRAAGRAGVRAHRPAQSGDLPGRHPLRL